MPELAESESICLKCHPEVAWAVDIQGLTLIRKDTRERFALAYPRAAIWDLISRGVPRGRIERIVAVIARVSQARANELISLAIEDWRSLGLLVEDANG